MNENELKKLMHHKQPYVNELEKTISLNCDNGKYWLKAEFNTLNSNFEIELLDNEDNTIQLNDDLCFLIADFLEKEYNEYVNNNTVFTSDDYLHFENLIHN